MNFGDLVEFSGLPAPGQKPLFGPELLDKNVALFPDSRSAWKYLPHPSSVFR
jgi:hypothetical protein